MKHLFSILILFSFVSVANAETWICEYKGNKENNQTELITLDGITIILKREEDKFIDVKLPGSGKYLIRFEDDELIHLERKDLVTPYKTEFAKMGAGSYIETILINKESTEFASHSLILNAFRDPGTQRGICTLTN